MKLVFFCYPMIGKSLISYWEYMSIGVLEKSWRLQLKVEEKKEYLQVLVNDRDSLIKELEDYRKEMIREFGP